jgi:hypothetical protein
MTNKAVIEDGAEQILLADMPPAEITEPTAADFPALHPGPTSAEIIRDIFRMHSPKQPGPVRVLDMTYGNGTFWKWDWTGPGIDLTKVDLYGTEDDVLPLDCTALPFSGGSFDWVVFDPPFTANGPQSEGSSSNDRYRATRGQDGAPGNAGQVRDLMIAGVLEACRVASTGIVVKMQDTVESGKLHLNVATVMALLNDDIRLQLDGGAECPNTIGWKVVDYVMFLPSRRAQPDAARGAVVRHFRNRPSFFTVAKRSSSR